MELAELIRYARGDEPVDALKRESMRDVFHPAC
jgi:hypothetical protein